MKRLFIILTGILYIVLSTGFGFEVHAEQNNTLRSDYSLFETSGSARIQNKIQTAQSGTWKNDSNGWWYEYKDGSYPKNQLLKIGNDVYYFNGSGYMTTGWANISNKWYYFLDSGAMAKNWQLISGSWYYLKNGVMVTGERNIDGSDYYFEADGRMASGWKNIDNHWYYYGSSGAKAASQWIGDYYVKADGTMAANEWVDNHQYFVDSSGKWIPDYGKPQWKADANGWWYDNGDGTYPRSEWKMIQGVWYYFDGSGYMATGWRNIDNSWYFFDGSGRMLTDQWIDGYYYVGSDGRMAVNTWIGDYYVDGSGRWTQTADSSGSSTTYFIRSKNSNKFHYPNCPAVHSIKEKNMIFLYESRQELIASGLQPCEICKNY